jgi:hemerythrin-like domain-containing protein
MAKAKKKPLKKRAPRFLDLADAHGDLDELFEEHRHALLGFEFKAAHDAIEAFWRVLRAHIRVEDEIVLPAYTQRVGHVEGGSPELFLNEHRQMERWVQEFRRDVKRLAQSARTPKRADVLALLDREATFKNLLQHHDERERSFLYPLLDKATTSEERTQAFEAIRRIEIRRKDA